MTARCPDDERIERFVAAALADRERDEVADHIDACSGCHDVVAALVVTHEPLPAAGEPIASAHIGSYDLAGVLGIGGMGVVYAARDRELGRMVALKVLRRRDGSAGDDAELERRLIRESRAMARLAHPNVVAVHHVGRWRDRLYLAMEHVDGVTLRAWLAERPRRPAEVLELFRQAGEGLRAAHAAGLVHRDFKPDNVLIDRDGRARVSDFGLAAALPAAGEPGTDVLAASRRRAGTHGYMPPEVHAGAPADPRGDVFSFSVALHEALWQRHPFPRQPGEPVDRALREPAAAPPRRAGVPARVQRAVIAGLALDPARRPASMAAMLAALAPARRRPWLWVAAAIVVAGAAIPVAAWSRASEPSACAATGDRVGALWNPVRKATLAVPYLRTGQPHVAADWRRMAAGFDRAAGRWRAEMAAACREVDAGALSPELYDRRTDCLASRLDRIAINVDLLATGDVSISTTVADGATRAGKEQRCDSHAAETARIVPPSDPDTRRRVNELRRRLARLEQVTYAAGRRYTMPEVQALAVEAEAVGDMPTLAEVLLLLGDVQENDESLAAAEATRRRGALAAEAGRHDRVGVMLWTALTDQAVIYAADHAKAREYLDHARAALTRIGNPPDLLARHEMSAGWVEYHADRDNEQALVHFRRALSMWGETEDVSDHVPLEAIAGALDRADKRFEAIEIYQRLLREETHRLGPEHPALAPLHNRLAGAMLGSGRTWEGLRHATAARRLEHQRTPVDALAVAHHSFLEAIAYGGLRQYPQALVAADRALAIYGASEAGDPFRGMLRIGRMIGLAGLGRNAEALVEGDAALAAAAGTGDPFLTGYTRLFRALMLEQAGQLDAAAIEAQRTIDELVPVAGEVPELAPCYATIALARLRRGQPGALELARRGVDLYATSPHPEPTVIGELEYALAKAMLASPAARAGAREVAARARLRLVGHEGDRLVGRKWRELDRMLASLAPASRPSRSM